MKKTALIICIILLLINIPTYSQNITISSNSCVVIECQTGQVLFEKEAAKKYPTSSLSKLMVALVAVEKANLESVIAIEDNSENIPTSNGLLSVKEALFVMLISQSNSCAKAIAKHVNEKDFVKLMNDKARTIGIVNTKFDNVTGTKSENEYTTPYDMAVITREALKNELLREILSSKSHKMEATNSTIKSKNEMLVEGGNNFYQYATGGMTGTLENSNEILLSTGNKGMVELITIIYDSPHTKYLDAQKVMDNIFSSYIKTPLDLNLINLPKSKSVGVFSKKGEISFSIPQETVIMLPTEVLVSSLSYANDIKPKYRHKSIYNANLTITAAGISPITIPLTATETKVKSKLLILWIILGIILIPIILILLIAAYYIIDSNRKKKKRRQEKFKRTLRVKKM